jgi:hypothetical protein
MSFTDKVRRKLENDEPKCGNCAHWEDTSPLFRTIRLCRFGSHHVSDPNSTGGRLDPRYTTDLSLCSAWEQK